MKKFRVMIIDRSKETLFFDTSKVKDIQEILDAFAASTKEEISVFEKNKDTYDLVFRATNRPIGF